MRTKIVSMIGLFVLLALGTVLVATEAKAAAAPVSFEQAAQGFTPMSGSCNYFCSKCIPLNGGACNAFRSCC